MLRINTLSASAVALIAGIGSASAADIITYEPTPTPPAYSPMMATDWTGPYVGLVGGYGFGGGSIGHNGLLGGAYAGYNFQVTPNWVVGLEGDLTATGKSGTNGTTTASNPWNGTVRGRIGYSVDRYLFYGTGGVAFGGVKAVTGGTSESATKTGWTLGAGIEAALTEKLTGRAELRHTNLGSQAWSASTPSTIGYSSTDVMLGLGFRF